MITMSKTTRTAPASARRAAISRRDLMRSASATAATAALMSAAKAAFPAGAFAQSAGPEVKKAILGYIALMDAAPLVIAKEKGFFGKHGMPDV
jgi:nitrate/nitrite transport system substrate-binding protein